MVIVKCHYFPCICSKNIKGYSQDDCAKADLSSLCARACRICPLGGLTVVFSRFRPFKKLSLINLIKVEEKCIKCGKFKRVYPPQITEIYEEKGGDVTESDCILCFCCVEMCPYEDCLPVEVGGKKIYKSKNWLKEETE